MVSVAQTSPDGVVSFKQAKANQEASGTFTVSQGVQSAQALPTVDMSAERLHALAMADGGFPALVKRSPAATSLCTHLSQSDYYTFP